MTVRETIGVIKKVALVAALGLLSSGCVYDYLQHSDRISYRAGDAVKANLARETIDPSKESMNSTAGLGKNGHVIPMPADAAATAPAPAAAAPVN